MQATQDSTSCGHCGHDLAADALFCPNCGTARSRHTDGDPLLGTVMGERFLILDRLGHGGSGTIYRAEHVTLRRKVAIKVLHHELSRDDLAVERFRREATTVSELDNEHIVQIHDFGRTEDGRLYLAMELLEGETLEDLVKREKRLPPAQTVDILTQLGEALAEAHAMGYVHRDLRPRNIWLATRRGKSNFVKLLDFGLAKLVAHEGLAAATSLGMTFGDPKYMSPEQARGEPLDRRADIYSMGCIAYEMLVGEPPFAGSKIFDILTQHLDTEPLAPLERRDDLPPWLSNAVLRMLAKDPDDRFITVYRLIEVLREGSPGTEDRGEAASEASGPAAAPASAPASALANVLDSPPASASMSLPADASASPLDSPLASPLDSPSAGASAGASDSPPTNAPPRRARAGTMPGIASSRPASEDPAPGIASSRPVGEDPAADPGASRGHGTNPGFPAVTAAPKPEPEPTQLASPTAKRPPQSAAEAEEAPPPDQPSGTSGHDRSAGASISGGLAGAWFADAEGDLDESARKRLDNARVFIDPGDTDAIDKDAAFYDPSRRPLGKIAAIGGGVIALIVLLVVLWPSGGGEHAGTTQDGKDPGSASAQPSSRPSAAALLASLDQQTDAAAADAGAADAAQLAPPATALPQSAAAARSTPRGPDRSTADTPASPRNPVLPRNPGRRPAPASGDTEALADPWPSDQQSDQNAEQAAHFAKLGQQALRNGNIPGAASNFNKARELDPRNADAIIGQGEIALRQGSYANASAHLKQAARLRPRSAQVHTMLGEVYLGMGNKAQAAASFKRALSIDSNHARARDGYREATGNPAP